MANFFSGELPSNISGDSLGILDLSNNKITGKIPPSIGNLKSLQALFLGRNTFQGEIPSEIFDIDTLSKVNITSNNFSSEIPTSISRCTYFHPSILVKTVSPGKFQRILVG
ncbi:receptor protein kinase clavata1 [Quercus suber]|uniref:Receptor protein kinase clavata1 n=1 Tax=Quercus suber TaxID=58331 RepID=A0AAW0LCM6_QUESU|nr:receptor protein kinase clavata1 [Quercus suber]